MQLGTEFHFTRLRKQMVETQLLERGIFDLRVLNAMARVPRHRFVPPALELHAYEDSPLAIGGGQTISQPFMVAALLEALELGGSERVLDIGTGSGYQAAVLGDLARHVVSVEIIPEHAVSARKVLAELGYSNVDVVLGDGSAGYPGAAPYDAIVVAAAAASIPQPLVNQLADGGRLVMPVGDRYAQRLTRVRKRGRKLEVDASIRCEFVPLVGVLGFQGDDRSEKLLVSGDPSC